VQDLRDCFPDVYMTNTPTDGHARYRVLRSVSIIAYGVNMALVVALAVQPVTEFKIAGIVMFAVAFALYYGGQLALEARGVTEEAKFSTVSTAFKRFCRAYPYLVWLGLAYTVFQLATKGISVEFTYPLMASYFCLLAAVAYRSLLTRPELEAK
jgi:hypothetical protein